MTNADHASLSGDEPLDLPEFDAPPSAPLPLAQRWLAEALPPLLPGAVVGRAASAKGFRVLEVVAPL